MSKQLCIPAYIMENRSPTLEEMCGSVGAKPVKTPKGQKITLFKKKLEYPANWRELSHSFKEKVGYRCQSCNLQCLRPSDPKSHLSRSEIAKLTLNTHHVDGNGMNNDLSNTFVVCSKCHLDIHRNTGGVPPKGQLVIPFSHAARFVHK
ncbi:MAG: hypothetical protein AAFR77_13025 [Cyanobacteria bacterium J06631_2]